MKKVSLLVLSSLLLLSLAILGGCAAEDETPVAQPIPQPYVADADV